MAINIGSQHAAQINVVEGTLTMHGNAYTAGSPLRTAVAPLHLTPQQRSEVEALIERADRHLAGGHTAAAADPLEQLTGRLRAWGALTSAATGALTQLATTLGPAGAALHRVLTT
jgi:hypothetical protein